MLWRASKGNDAGPTRRTKKPALAALAAPNPPPRSQTAAPDPPPAHQSSRLRKTKNRGIFTKQLSNKKGRPQMRYAMYLPQRPWLMNDPGFTAASFFHAS
jgi:hypothetical protein